MCSNDFFFMLCSNALYRGARRATSHIFWCLLQCLESAAVFLPASVQERQIQLSPQARGIMIYTQQNSLVLCRKILIQPQRRLYETLYGAALGYEGQEVNKPDVNIIFYLVPFFRKCAKLFEVTHILQLMRFPSCFYLLCIWEEF